MNRIQFTAVWLKLSWLLACLMAGCSSAAIASPSAKHAGPLYSLIAIVDFDDASLVPELPDDFGKDKTGTAPELADNPGEKSAPALPVVMVFGPPHCAPCAKVIKELNATGRYDACKAEITPGIANVAATWNQGRYPIATFGGENHAKWFVVWDGLKDFEIRFHRRMGKPAAGAATALQLFNAPAVALYYHGQSSSWTWPGDLRRHLVAEHGYSANQVAGMSDAQVIAAHDAAHNATTMRAQAAPRVRHRARANCPDGRCPL